MLNIIKKAYRLFFSNLPIILIFSIPLLILSAVNIANADNEDVSLGLHYFLVSLIFLAPLVSAGTDIAIYQLFFKYKIINPFRNIKTLFLYLVVQFVIGLIAVAPIFVFHSLLSNFITNEAISLSLAVFINMFAGFYILARFNIILPLIIQEKIPGYKDFLKMTNQKYLSWVGVSFAIYLPYLLINYFIPNAYVNMFFVTLAMVLFHSFSAAYALENKLVTTGPAEKIIPEKSSKPKIQKEKHAEPKLAMPPRLKQAIEEKEGTAKAEKHIKKNVTRKVPKTKSSKPKIAKLASRADIKDKK